MGNGEHQFEWDNNKVKDLTRVCGIFDTNARMLTDSV